MKMVVFIFLGLFIASSVSHSITQLDVPRWADPRRDAELRCRYTRQATDPPLHSLKWYRDSHEIFRYTPQEFESRSFNSSEISISNSSCDASECAIWVHGEKGTAKYTCEVSSEGPRFAVDKRAANLTMAVLPEYDPLITGLPTMVQVGEQALVNCTSDYSIPAATIDWFVDAEPQEVQDDSGELHGISQATVCRICARVARALARLSKEFIFMPNTVQEQEQVMREFRALRNFPNVIGAIDCTHIRIKKTGGDAAQYYINRKGYYSLNVQDPVITGVTHISGADSEGLRASWRTLHVYPDDYNTHRGYLSLRCRATIATRPPHVRSMSVRLYVAARPHISSYMFSKNNAAPSNSAQRLQTELIRSLCVLTIVKLATVPMLDKYKYSIT